MTDDRDSNQDGVSEPRDAAYDAIARRILDYRDTAGRRPGIYGANRCQLCGTITPFSTLVGAQMSHFGPDRERACAACVKQRGRAAIAAAIEALGERRCEVCGRGVERSPANRLDGLYWVCESCRREAGRGDPRLDSADGLSELVRLRYMALAYPTVEELLRLEQTVLAIKADLDRLASQPAHRGGRDEQRGDSSSCIIVGFPSSGRLR
jgi:hypothetical protein